MSAKKLAYRQNKTEGGGREREFCTVSGSVRLGGTEEEPRGTCKAEDRQK